MDSILAPTLSAALETASRRFVPPSLSVPLTGSRESEPRTRYFGIADSPFSMRCLHSFSNLESRQQRLLSLGRNGRHRPSGRRVWPDSLSVCHSTAHQSSPTEVPTSALTTRPQAAGGQRLRRTRGRSEPNEHGYCEKAF